jgi:hypothetical protein
MTIIKKTVQEIGCGTSANEKSTTSAYFFVTEHAISAIC